MSKQWFNPWVTQCVVKLFIANLFDFASNAKLKFNKNCTLIDLAIVTNVSIYDRWDMTFFTNVLEASCTNWDY
jgi:hypothetical protein